MRLLPNGFLLSVSLLSTFTGLVRASDVVQQVVPTPLQEVRVQGDLERRVVRAVGYLDRATRQQLWSGFERMLTNDHSWGMWGGDWPGRTLEAYSRTSLLLGRPSTQRFDEVGFGLLAHQVRDGSFPNGLPQTEEARAYHAGAGLWFGNARAMLGLIWAHRFRNADSHYLAAARMLGEYYESDYFRSAASGTPSSFWWVATEALEQLYETTGERKYLDTAVRVAESIPPLNSHSQHTHSYLLSLRGIVAICEQLDALGPDEPRSADAAETRQRLEAKVREQYAFFRDRVMWPGGGIVEHLGDAQGKSLCYWYDEGCSVCDWLGLNLDLWRLTGDTQYLDMAERVALNHLLFDQDAEGGFCGDRGIDFVREGSPWPFCCAMHGTRTLTEIAQYICTSDSQAVFVSFFYPSKTRLVVAGTSVEITLETNYPADGKVSITLAPERPVSFPLRIRQPAWSRTMQAHAGGDRVPFRADGGWLVCETQWQAGDRIQVEIDLPLRSESRGQFIGDAPATDYQLVSLWQGPRQLVYNQQFNNQLWQQREVRPGLRHVYQAYGDLRFDQSVNQTPLRIGDRSYAKGLGTHSVSELVYALAGRFVEFRTDVGIDSIAEGGGAVRFKVCVDGLVRHGDVVKASIGEESQGQVATLYGFNVMARTGKDPAQSLRIDVTKAQVLRLVVDDAVNGQDKDYADWGDARLISADGTVTYLSDLPDDRAEGLPWDWTAVRLTEWPHDAVADGGPEVGQSAADVVLTGMWDTRQVPVGFSFLSALGDELIRHRPVLRSWIKLDPEKPD